MTSPRYVVRTRPRTREKSLYVNHPSESPILGMSLNRCWVWNSGGMNLHRSVAHMPANVLRELAGVSVSQFAELVIELGPLWEAQRLERLSAHARHRQMGGGRKPFPFAGRLLLALVHLRWNLPFRMIGVLFGVSKDTVQRSSFEIVPLLAAYGITAPDGNRVRTGCELAEQLSRLAQDQRVTLLDGSFVPVARPKTREAQRRIYSGYRHRYTTNFQALTDDTGSLLWVGGVRPGSTHDLTAIAESDAVQVLAATGVTVVADKGYRGIKKRLGLNSAVIPVRRQPKNQMPRPEWVQAVVDEHNHDISRTRVRVEHAFSNMKRFRILTGYRGKTRSDITATISAVAALASLPN